MNRAAQLLHLQELEDDIDEKTDRLKRVQVALRGSREVAQARKQYEETQAKLEEIESEQRRREMDLKTLEQEIEQKEQHLYSGKVTNPKELEAYQKDVKHARRRREKLDDEVLRGMDELEAARAAYKEAEQRLEKAKAQWEQRKRDLSDLADKLKRYILNARQKRKSLRNKISDSDLSMYEETARRKGSIAVAEVKNGACGVCGVNMSHGKLETVKRGDTLVLCGNCDRILAIP